MLVVVETLKIRVKGCINTEAMRAGAVGVEPT